jgi:NAD-dependent deacetylase sirtuin 4
VQPNAAHEAIARLQGRGWLDLVITQNVDRLHHKGGSGNVLELHGTTHR